MNLTNCQWTFAHPSSVLMPLTGSLACHTHTQRPQNGSWQEHWNLWTLLFVHPEKKLINNKEGAESRVDFYRFTGVIPPPWTGILSWAYSCLTPIVPKIDSGLPAILTRIAVSENEWVKKKKKRNLCCSFQEADGRGEEAENGRL